MMRLTNPRECAIRQGGITPMACLLLPLILGMVAFAVDMSWLVLTRSELQNAAESAAFCNSERVNTSQLISTANATMPRIKGKSKHAIGVMPPCRIAHSLGFVSRIIVLLFFVPVSNAS